MPKYTLRRDSGEITNIIEKNGKPIAHIGRLAVERSVSRAEFSDFVKMIIAALNAPLSPPIKREMKRSGDKILMFVKLSFIVTTKPETKPSVMAIVINESNGIVEMTEEEWKSLADY